MNTRTLQSDALEVKVNPRVGGTLTRIRHKPTGLSVLGSVPWESVDAPLDSGAARDEAEWLTRYTGGWPLLFPNAGDACTIEGTFHGFHGEASISPWEVEAEGDSALVLTRALATIPATMRREIGVRGETLTIDETLAYHGRRPAEVMWGHHPTFGSDLLGGPFEITAGARFVEAEALYDPPASPVVSGARAGWPSLPSKTGGDADLAHPRDPWASVAYLTGFDAFWAAIRRMDDAIAALLTWDGTLFPCAWLWHELSGTQDVPWNGVTRLIGIEPCTTPCALGLGTAKSRNMPLLRLLPDATISARIALHVFKPSGPILNGLRDIPNDQGTGRS